MESIIALLFPAVAYAAPPNVPAPVKTFIGKISTEILDPIIAILFALATAYFFFGVAKYIWDPDNEESREKGRTAMIYGVIGMFIMVAVFGILAFIISSTGADPSLMNYV
jgi:uncharacterized membrane protein YfcA